MRLGGKVAPVEVSKVLKEIECQEATRVLKNGGMLRYLGYMLGAWRFIILLVRKVPEGDPDLV